MSTKTVTKQATLTSTYNNTHNMFFFTYLLLAFAVITAINCAFYLYFSKFSFSKHKKSNETNEPVSVVVYVKNDDQILERFLQKIGVQINNDLELVLVNNASYDNSLEIIEKFKNENTSKNIHIVNVENNEAFWGSKKYALTLGIKKATHEKLLFLTPSAEVIADNWIKTIVGFFSEEKQIVVGYQNYENNNGILNKLMRYHHFQSFFQNFGMASWSKPYFASENNVAYTKPLFFENNGFSAHMNEALGTENLFIKEASTTKNVVLATNASSRILTKAPSFKNWLAKTKLHLQSFKLFSGSVKFSLSLFYFTQLLFWIGAIAGGLVYQNLFWFILIGVRFIIAGISIGKAAFKLGEKDLFYLFPILEITNVLTQLFIYTGNLFSKSKH